MVRTSCGGGRDGDEDGGGVGDGDGSVGDGDGGDRDGGSGGMSISVMIVLDDFLSFLSFFFLIQLAFLSFSLSSPEL